jgi:uncharacterized cupin superfamily protein
MLRHFILFLATAITLSVAAQTADTLTAGVHPSPAGGSPMVLKGSTRDLADLDVRLLTIQPGETFNLPANETADYLLIVKDGKIGLNTDAISKTLGPGGVGLFSDPLHPTIHNVAGVKTHLYLFKFKSRAGADRARGLQAGTAFIADWPDLVMKKTDKGESRAIFSQSTTWFKNINMHATTLNPGEISHPQHVHRAEEILLLRGGNVRMHIADGYLPAEGGDLVFLPSGVPHDLENGNTGRTEYFALQWEP